MDDKTCQADREAAVCAPPTPSPQCRTFSAAVTPGILEGCPEPKRCFKKKKKGQKRCVTGFVCPTGALFRGETSGWIIFSSAAGADSICRNSFGSFMRNGTKMGALQELCFPSEALKLRYRLFMSLYDHVQHHRSLIPQMTSKTFQKEQRRYGNKLA